MRIAIVGAGALGLYYGALLQRSGQDVHFLLRRDFEAVSRKGLKVFSINGDFELPSVQAYRTPQEIGPVDLVLVGLKTFANDRYAELITPLVGEGTQILTLQNGLGNEEALAELFGAERIIGGVAFLCSNRGEPGEVHHLAAGRIILGEYQPYRSAAGRASGRHVRAGRCRLPGNGRSQAGPLGEAGLEYPLQRSVRPAAAAGRSAADRSGDQAPGAGDHAGGDPGRQSARICPGRSPKGMPTACWSSPTTWGSINPPCRSTGKKAASLRSLPYSEPRWNSVPRRGIAMPRVEMLATLLEQVQ